MVFRVFLAERNRLVNFSRGPYDEQLGEIGLKLDQHFRRICSLNTIIFSFTLNTLGRGPLDDATYNISRL